MRRAAIFLALLAVVAAVGLLWWGNGGSPDAPSESTPTPPTTAAPDIHAVVTAKLTGAAETTAKSSLTGSGTATITLDTKTGKACWTLDVHGLDEALSADVQHGARGVAGPVIIPLGGRFAKRGCVIAPARSIAAVAANPSAYYVNVYTQKHLEGGAIRGQLVAISGG